MSWQILIVNWQWYLEYNLLLGFRFNFFLCFSFHFLIILMFLVWGNLSCNGNTKKKKTENSCFIFFSLCLQNAYVALETWMLSHIRFENIVLHLVRCWQSKNCNIIEKCTNEWILIAVAVGDLRSVVRCLFIYYLWNHFQGIFIYSPLFFFFALFYFGLTIEHEKCLHLFDVNDDVL